MKLIYIAGDGRSGSTLLEILLSTAPHSLSIGEASRFWVRYAENEAICGCGDVMGDCELWKGLTTRLGWDNRAFFNEMITGVKNINLYRNFSKIPQFAKDPAWKSFNSNVMDFYNGIADISNKKVLIDSSKSIGWVRYLQALDFCEIKIIHLERSLPGVANSWKKDLMLPEYPNLDRAMPKRSNFQIIKSAMKIRKQAKELTHQGAFFSLRYETLIGSLNETLNNLSDFIGAEVYVPETIPANHGIGGNPLRHQQKFQIHSAEQSLSRLNALEKLLFNICDNINKGKG